MMEFKLTLAGFLTLTAASALAQSGSAGAGSNYTAGLCDSSGNLVYTATYATGGQYTESYTPAYSGSNVTFSPG